MVEDTRDDHRFSEATKEAPLVAILGPTASGKSALGVRLAQQFGGEVIACDSTQVYRGFDIGTAKPTMKERGGIPHHMLDIADPSETFTAGEYRRRAVEALAEMKQRGRLPILTVGTGLYLRALLEGLADAPARSEELRLRLEHKAAAHGSAYLHKLLQRIDVDAAERISPNDRQKLIRALEVCLLTGKRLTEVHRSGRQSLKGYTVIKLGLNPPRAELYARIEQRVHGMMARGWRDEAASLMENEGDRLSKPFEFIGYRNLCVHVEIGIALPATIEAISQATRRYAKRQMTWFRKESDVCWFEGFGDDEEIVSRIVAHLQDRLGTRPEKSDGQEKKESAAI